jgi:hypothetical protein
MASSCGNSEPNGRHVCSVRVIFSIFARKMSIAGIFSEIVNSECP